MIETASQSLKQWRAANGITLSAAIDMFGMNSKGYLSDIENGKRPAPLALALEIERVTGGAVPAATLSPDVALVEAARAAKPVPAIAAAGSE